MAQQATFATVVQEVNRLDTLLQRVEGPLPPSLRELQEHLLQIKRTCLMAQRKGAIEATEDLKPETLVRFLQDLYRFLAPDPRIVERLGFHKIQLVLSFDAEEQSFDPIYDLQDAWAAQIIFRRRPEFFVDVGSRLTFLMITSRLVPCIGVDVRPTPVEMPQLTFRVGEAQNLPFEDDSVPLLTSLNAPEHFGLGRYGDPIDPYGPERAFAEFRRVVQPGGWILLCVPVHYKPILVFNLMRAFSVEQVRSYFEGYPIVTEQFLDAKQGPIPQPEPYFREREVYYAVAFEKPA